MPRKLGGLVCDNDDCRIFIDYWDQEGIKNWHILATRNGSFCYCSKECSELDKNNRTKEINE